MLHSKPFSRSAIDDLLALIANNAAARWPDPPYLMTSDVAWQLPGSMPEENIRLWYDDNGILAYLWFQPPGDIKLDVRQGVPLDDGVLGEMLAWAVRRRAAFSTDYPFYLDLESMDQWRDVLRNRPRHPLAGNRYLTASAFEHDGERTDLLVEHGFEPTPHFELHLAHDLEKLPEPRPPLGITLRHVLPTDFERRVDVHVAAWAPGSSFNMERYLEVRAMDQVFDPELDIVAEKQDGTFASYTIAWRDPVSGLGSFEPFGTRPEFRGTGVSRAVIYEGLRRLSRKGMRAASIYTAGFNHPAARLYESCGFVPVERKRTFLKQC